MKLSIIIPAYKSEQSITRCLGSLIKGAGYIDYEVIVVSDDTEAEERKRLENKIHQVELYYNKRVILLNNKGPKGVGGARNTGLEVAIGEYIWFVDSDDVAADDWGQQVGSCIQNSDIDLVIAGYEIVSNGQCIEKRMVPNENQVEINKFIDEHMQPLQLEWLLNPVWNKLYLRRTIDQLRFDVNCSMGEDLAFCLSFLQQANKVGFCPRILYTYIIGENDNSLCKSFHKEAVDMSFSNWEKETELLNRYDVLMIPQVVSEYCAARNAYEEELVTKQGGKISDLIGIQRKAKNIGFPGSDEFALCVLVKYIVYKYISLKMLFSRIKHGQKR